MVTSNCEAEYKAAFIATIEGVWLGRLMTDLGVGQDTANTIYTDSQSVLAVARNPVFHACTKHIEVHYHYVRERPSTGEISLAYVPAQDNLANLFTKALSYLQCLGTKKQAKPICLVGLKLEDMDMDDWIELDELARSTIMLTLHKSIYFNVKDTKGAYGVWQALGNLYEKKSAASKVFWHKKLIDLHKKETTPMPTHLNEFKTILSRFQAHEVEF
ncbi:hypothetical protein L7F22_053110 [Adiantum nelumboides]|nr:hypothetical protein [Adiantum nelumboides]